MTAGYHSSGLWHEGQDSRAAQSKTIPPGGNRVRLAMRLPQLGHLMRTATRNPIAIRSMERSAAHDHEIGSTADNSQRSGNDATNKRKAMSEVFLGLMAVTYRTQYSVLFMQIESIPLMSLIGRTETDSNRISHNPMPLCAAQSIINHKIRITRIKNDWS